jgi:hypothetical protein
MTRSWIEQSAAAIALHVMCLAFREVKNGGNEEYRKKVRHCRLKKQGRHAQVQIDYVANPSYLR